MTHKPSSRQTPRNLWILTASLLAASVLLFVFLSLGAVPPFLVIPAILALTAGAVTGVAAFFTA